MAVRGSFGGHSFFLFGFKCVILLRCCLPLKKSPCNFIFVIVHFF